MSAPSMVHRSGNTLIVRSVVSGDAIYGDEVKDKEPEDLPDNVDLPDCKIKRNYSCSTCEFFTQNPRHFLYHLRDVHKEKVKIYECPSCIYASKHFQKLLRHAKMVHGGTEGVELPEFPRGKGKKRGLPEEEAEDNPDPIPVVENGEEEANVSSDREKNVFKCSLCTFTARGQNQLTRHEREEHIKTKFFRCTKCTYVTHMKARFTKHVKYHSMPMIKCDMCDFRTPYKWNLDRHCKNHNGNGAFRCSACNFTADIKQSLTVHEMNHHVPPVGQAAGLGVGRRRNKVGASDSVGAEEAASTAAAAPAPAQVANAIEQHHQQDPSGSDVVAVAASNDNKKFTTEKLKITSKKLKTAKNQEPQQHQHPQHQQSNHSFGSDFIHPDDIIHHANGNIYIKNKCKLCNFKSAWDGEMARHEEKVHNILKNKPVPVAKKPTRPVPNLIPIPTANALKMPGRPETLIKAPEPPYHPPEEIISQKDMNDICAKSANSALRDFASLFNSEDVFNNSATAVQKAPEENLMAELLRTDRASPLSDKVLLDSTSVAFKRKNASFFDKLKEKLLTGAGESANLTCQYCGHKSKCLSELAGHQKTCGKQQVQAQNVTLTHNISSSRCQYCRQRCKCSADLFVHLQTCPEAIKKIYQQEVKENDLDAASSVREIKEIDENFEEIGDEEHLESTSQEETKPHPMENRVFVWNNIEVPLDIELNDHQNLTDQQYYDYNSEERQEDNVSLDLSIRTQSPMSENSYVGSEPATHRTVSSTEKIPTHGNDINTAQVAQHKRVFKCPHCSFWASTASRFHVHIVGHLNKKPFECSLCAYRSNWRWDITKHIKLKSVRDPAHEQAKVLMTDETGRRNYTKYNKYLTEIQFTGDHNETSGGAGTRPRNNHDSHNNNNNDSSFNQTLTLKTELPKLSRAPSSSDFSPLLKGSPLRPPPPLKAADESFFAKISSEKRKNNSDAKKTLWKCKKCNFRDASHEKLLNHVKGHYQQDIGFQGNNAMSGSSSDAQALNNDEASEGRAILRGHAPFRCGHCHQVSNWKHVIQRHCRLKHRGDIRVLVGTKSGVEKLEVDDQTDEPDHIDVPQTGTFKCKQCPFSNNDNEEFENHLACHAPKSNSIMKCYFCTYFVSQKEELCEHLKLHGILEPEEYMLKMVERNGNDPEFSKKYQCVLCPYVTNSKSQFLYHKQFHKPRGGQYSCTICNYNVSKRHLLHQHLKVHGTNGSLSNKQDDVIDLDELPDESEEISSMNSSFESQNFPDIPLVWVSKAGKFSKMFKCRFCPHVNLRKVNIQEHEKMHGYREKASTKGNEVEHRCNECNYVCNNAGVLSSHSKVHQGLYGQIHCLVDSTKSDDEQIRELSRLINLQSAQENDNINLENEYESAENSAVEIQEEEKEEESHESLLHFCNKCPARFLKEKEYIIHLRFHCVRLFYKCEYCTYAARQKPHLLSHSKVHTSEYQERTKELRAIYSTNSNHGPPQLVALNQNGEVVWVALENTLNELHLENFENDVEAIPAPSKPKPMVVPLSGTELFQQKAEAEKQSAAEKLLQKPIDQTVVLPHSENPNFETFINGNPKFVYPTYLKNGRMKEKRYKCHKCPSAFEKREQYKVHLSLHGAKQKYKCEYCDYSVKYFANYAQHLRKHQKSDDAQATKKSGDSSEEMEIDEEEIDETAIDMTLQHPRASKNISSRRGPLKLSTADRQALMIINQRRSSNGNSNKDVFTDDKKLFWCSSCPYTNHRKDAVDNHQKRHVSVSGFENNYTCEHCDYSAPQQHFIRDHSKLHFMENKMHQVEGYMACDGLKLTSKRIKSESGTEMETDNEHVIFETVETKNGESNFFPSLDKDVLDNLNNNKVDKIFVNPDSGEVVKRNRDTEKENNIENEESIS